jgi:hypothetical protein
VFFLKSHFDQINVGFVGEKAVIVFVVFTQDAAAPPTFNVSAPTKHALFALVTDVVVEFGEPQPTSYPGLLVEPPANKYRLLFMSKVGPIQTSPLPLDPQ